MYLEKILKAKGHSQKWLSEQTGISMYRLHRIIHLIQEPKLSDMKRIARVLQLPLETIFFVQDVPIPKNKHNTPETLQNRSERTKGAIG